MVNEKKETMGQRGRMSLKLCCISEFVWEASGLKCHVRKRKRGGEQREKVSGENTVKRQ